MMHNKFAVFDEVLVVTGSYNWTQGAEHANYENVLFEDSPNVVQAYMRQFADLWASAKPLRAAPTPFKPLFQKWINRN